MNRTRLALRSARIALYLALCITLAVAATGCNAIAGLFGRGTATYTDDMGRAIEVPRRINRIVSLAPANTEILYAVGAGPKVVGVDEYSNYPPETTDVPKVGGFLDVNVEAVIALKPDLVLASSMHKAPVEQLEAAGIKVLVVEPHTLQDVYDDIEKVGKLAGQEEKAREVVSAMKAKIAAVRDRIDKSPVEYRPVVFYEVWGDPLQSAGPNTYTHQIIDLAGGNNLCADAATDYPLVGYEVVVARNPELIVFPTFHGAQIPTVEQLAARPGWSAIKAIREGNVKTIDADIMSRGGPRLADAVELMAKLIHPSLFPE